MSPPDRSGGFLRTGRGGIGPLLARATPHLALALHLALITALARAVGEPLLLFPELGALSSVALLNPGNPWMRSPGLLVLTPLLTGSMGIAISSHLAYGPLSVVLVVVSSLLIIQVLRSPVIPALASGLLPLALGIDSWLYPVALLPGTLSLALLLILRRRHRSVSTTAAMPTGTPLPLDPEAPQPRTAGIAVLPPPGRWVPSLALFLAGALLLVHGLGSHLALFPPLLVIAFETLAHAERVPWRDRPLALLGATGGGAVIGLVLEHSLSVTPLATLLAALLTSLLLHLIRLRCPPAYATTLLPFVITAPSATYPLLVLAGTAWLVVVAGLTAGLRRRRGERECTE